MAFWDRNKNSQELRVIKTARDKDSINRAAKSGLKPLIKKVEPSDKIRSKYSQQVTRVLRQAG
jgi:ribosomal protein S20